MSRFNISPPPNFTPNYAGGDAHQQSPELELVSILLTSFANDTFYRTDKATFERLRDLIHVLPVDFVCKAGIYARTVFGMRSITHVLAGEVAIRVSGKPFGESFYNKIVHRIDDMSEILAYYKSIADPANKTVKKLRLPNAMKKGFAKAFDRFGAYHLAKYRSADKDFKLIDVVNLVHPKPTATNSEALAGLLKGTLKNTETWESMLSAASDKVAKAFAWDHLISNKKLGYLALLRNLRNIMQDAPSALPVALKSLTDPEFIAKSLIMPFQYQTALEQFKTINEASARNIMVYLNKALDVSCVNVPQFEGSTLVVLDTSVSMTDGEGKPAKIGALFAAVLRKSNNCDFITFDNEARYVNYNPMDSTLTLSGSIKFNGGGTNFHSIFETASKKYDRVIILSDMQGWMATSYGATNPVRAFIEYKHRTGADPFIYSFDLAGLGTMQFPERKVFCLAGFSDKVFSIMALLEKDKNALLNEIKSIAL